MNERSMINSRNALDKTKEICFLKKELPDEELRRLVRRAVKSIEVPADFESRLFGLLKKQS